MACRFTRGDGAENSSFKRSSFFGSDRPRQAKRQSLPNKQPVVRTGKEPTSKSRRQRSLVAVAVSQGLESQLLCHFIGFDQALPVEASLKSGLPPLGAEIV